MEKNYFRNMRRFLADQVLYLAAGIVIIRCVPIYCGPIFSIILGGAAILSWGFLCRWILLLPIDLVLGKKEKIVYFSSRPSRSGWSFSLRRPIVSGNSIMEVRIPSRCCFQRRTRRRAPPGTTCRLEMQRSESPITQFPKYCWSGVWFDRRMASPGRRVPNT